VILFCLGNMQSQGTGIGAAQKKAAPTVSSVLKDFRTLLSNRTMVTLCITSIFRSMTQSTLMTFLPLFLATMLHYPPAWIGACMAGLQVAGFIGTPIAGHLADKTSPRSIMMSSMAMSAVILLSMAIAGNSPWFVFFVSFLGFFMFAIRAVLQAWLLDATPPEMSGRSIALLFAIQAIGSGSGPLIGGILADRYGLWAVFYFLACTIVIANMFVLFTPVPQQHRFEGAPAE
jgi:predicted MFS family arabinose efflux permease